MPNATLDPTAALRFDEEKARMNLLLARGAIRAGYIGYVTAPFFAALHYALPDSLYPDGSVRHARLP